MKHPSRVQPGILLKFQMTGLSRRTMLKRGFGVFAMFAETLIGLYSLAEVLSRPAPRQSLGPFFPYDGTEVELIRENPDPDLPIQLGQ
jgi:protocatechuate 3,4-dioxygenase, beta subunit